MLDRLPDPILLNLIDECPQLGFINRKLFGLAELSSRSWLLNYFDYNAHRVNELANDVWQNMHFGSWLTIKEVAQRDYWFFGPEHIVEFNGYSINETNHTSHPMNQRKQHFVIGVPWGLYILKLSSQHLEYTTNVKAGKYDIYLDMFSSRIEELSKMRFCLVESPSAKQNFTSVPPIKHLMNQLRGLQYKKGVGVPLDQSLLEEVEAYRLLVGSIDIAPTESSKWLDITLKIDMLDWSEPISGLLLNYLSFNPHSDLNKDREWLIQPSNIKKSPTHSLAMVYKRASERRKNRPQQR